MDFNSHIRCWRIAVGLRYRPDTHGCIWTGPRGIPWNLSLVRREHGMVGSDELQGMVQIRLDEGGALHSTIVSILG